MSHEDLKFLYASHFMNASRINALGKMLLARWSKQDDHDFNALWSLWEKLSREDFRELCQRTAELSEKKDIPTRPSEEMLQFAEGIWAAQDSYAKQLSEQSESK